MQPARETEMSGWGYHVEPIQPIPNYESPEDTVQTLAIKKYLDKREHSVAVVWEVIRVVNPEFFLLPGKHGNSCSLGLWMGDATFEFASLISIEMGSQVAEDKQGPFSSGGLEQ